MYKRKLTAGFIVPAQPVTADKPPLGPDGFTKSSMMATVIIRRESDTVRLWSRHAVDFTKRMPAIVAAAAALRADRFVLDGEAVAIGLDGLSRFDELRGQAGARRAILYAFDLIELDGEDLRELPLLERKAALADLVGGSGILLSEHVAEEGATVFAHACRLGAEGIVSKRVDSPYRSGPYCAWLKVRSSAGAAVQR
jgi:bifunctional non-homologous end joining protein LigD